MRRRPRRSLGASYARLVVARRTVTPRSSAARPRIATMIASVPVNGRPLELDDRVAVAAGELLADGAPPEVLAPSTLTLLGDAEEPLVDPFGVEEPDVLWPATPA